MSATVIAQLYAFAETPVMPPCDFESTSAVEDESLTPSPTEVIPPVVAADAADADLIGKDAAPEISTPFENIPPPADPDLWLYRRRTVGLLRKYMRLSIEVGRLPSLLGREFFRTRVTSYRASTFEDAVIFVHDVERSLEELNDFDQKLIAKIVLQEYPQEEAARLIGCGRRHAVRCFPEALDRVTEMFLKKHLLTRLPSTKSNSKKSCQGGKNDEFLVSDSEQAKNKGNNLLDSPTCFWYLLVMEREPQSLQEAIVYFSNPDNCIDYIAVRRWPNGVVCPGCGATKVSYNAKRRTWKCGSHHPKREFSIKVGTIYEDSPIPLDKWLTATWMLTNCKNGVSSYEIARDVKVTQKSAWFMLQRIRLAMQDEFFGSKLGGDGGEVEVDETFIGGKARNMHKSKRIKMKVREDNWGKTIVMGMLERGGKVRAKVVPNRKKPAIHSTIAEGIAAGTQLYTDDHTGYMDMSSDYLHSIVNHAEQYVDGRVHTNGIENFWSCLKRGLNGTYVSVEPFHLFRYLDEQMFRYNNRKNLDDAGRFDLVVRQIVGKRITFAQLTGKPN